MVLHLLQSDSGFVEIAVEVPVAALEEAVLRTAFVRVSGSVSSFRIYSGSEGTMRVCDWLTVSLSVVLRVASGQ